MARTLDERTREAESWAVTAGRLDHLTVGALCVTLGIWGYDFFSSENLIELDIGAFIVTLALAIGMVTSYRKSTYVGD